MSDLLERAAKEPLGIDISDYSDEFCAGFLAGQVNALEQSDCEHLRNAVQSFHDAYPEEVFPPLTKEQHKTAVEALRAAGVTSDQLHADWARRIVASIFRIAGEADE